ncbi:MAG: OapA family protein [Thalassotalea sp.]
MKRLKNIYLSLPRQHQVFISSLGVVLLLLLLLPSDDASASKQTKDIQLEVGKRYEIEISDNNHPLSDPAAPNISVIQANTEALQTTAPAELQTAKVQAPETELNWQTVKVKSGDSLAKIFKRNNFSAKTTYEVSQAKGEDSKKLLNLNVGDILRLGSDEQDKLVAIEYPLSKTTTLFVNHTEQGYEITKEVKDVELRQAYAHGTINSSFWHAGTAAGLEDAQIINLANIFGWDIDFALDIREGDTFHIVYQDKYVDGEYIGKGDILSAEFVNQNDTFHAVRFTDGEYYTPTGDSMRKAFLRAPVNFKYISSNFKRRRFHPISKKWKAHNGTDYRAATGTPVVAAGDGRVTHSTYNRFNGNYVFIQHGDGIVTKYLHFSKRAVKTGQRVKQGQTIGYVGSTGQSEAPHLHYEFLLNGVHRNPRTVKLPDAKAIDNKYKAEFIALAQTRLNELASSKKIYLAMQNYEQE